MIEGDAQDMGDLADDGIIRMLFLHQISIRIIFLSSLGVVRQLQFSRKLENSSEVKSQ